jgi:hypothetical protein
LSCDITTFRVKRRIVRVVERQALAHGLCDAGIAVRHETSRRPARQARSLERFPRAEGTARAPGPAMPRPDRAIIERPSLRATPLAGDTVE